MQSAGAPTVDTADSIVTAVPRQWEVLKKQPEIVQIHNGRFAVKMLEHGVIWFGGAYLVVADLHWAAALLGTILIGFVYARNLEFVHECIHFTAVTSRRLNRFFGILLSLPMLTSFEGWRRSHMQHHADVRNEGFQFDVTSITTVSSLISHNLMLENLRHVFKTIAQVFLGQGARNGLRPGEVRDHALMGGVILFGTGLSLWFESWLFVQLWLLPLIAGSIINFHIQLPEHFACDTASRDALRSSRTVTTGTIGTWLVNNNNFHAEHHWAPSVPIANLAEINAIIDPHLHYRSASYWSFFKDFYGNFYRTVRGHRA